MQEGLLLVQKCSLDLLLVVARLAASAAAAAAAHVLDDHLANERHLGLGQLLRHVLGEQARVAQQQSLLQPKDGDEHVAEDLQQRGIREEMRG